MRGSRQSVYHIRARLVRGGGEPPPLPPPPGGDSHHGPLPGVKRVNGLFSCVQPLALPHERSTPLRDLPRDPAVGVMRRPRAMTPSCSRSTITRPASPPEPL